MLQESCLTYAPWQSCSEDVLQLEVVVDDGTPFAILAHTIVAELKGHHQSAQQVPWKRPSIGMLPILTSARAGAFQ